MYRSKSLSSATDMSLFLSGRNLSRQADQMERSRPLNLTELDGKLRCSNSDARILLFETDVVGFEGTPDRNLTEGVARGHD